MDTKDHNVQHIDHQSSVVEHDDHERYIRQLVSVVSRGEDVTRRNFLRTHSRIIGGYAGYLLNLSEEDLEEAFTDSLAARHGSVPRTLMGFRLAFPVGLQNCREDMWLMWGKIGAGRPATRVADTACESPGRVKLTAVLTFPLHRRRTLPLRA